MDLLFLTSVVLIFVRISGMFMLIPIFGAKNIPPVMKIGFIFFISIISINVVGFSSGIYYDTLLELGYQMVFEFLIGVSFGMVSSIVMNSVYVAGLIVDRNIGFGMVSVISPSDGSQMPVTANLFYIFSMIIFLIGNIHHQLIRAVVYSFTVIPIGSGVIDFFVAKRLTDLLSESFVIGFKLSGPFIITILVANVLLGMLAKAMPGMNVFVIGLPLKVFVGLLTFTFVIDYYYGSFINMFELIFKYLMEFMGRYG